jgi:hypothetical protein
MATSICPSRKLDMRRAVSKGFMEAIVGLTPKLHKAANAIVRADNHARRWLSNP